MPKYISINGQVLRNNTKWGTNDPPIRVAKSKSDHKPVYAHGVKIKGDSELLYRHEEPILRCGARLVIICDDVEIVW